MTINYKPWGREEIVVKTENYVIKKIIVDTGCRLSLQYHNYKEETLIYPDGKIEHIPPKMIHRIDGPITIIEVSHGEDSDIVRLKDDYGRI
jgi:mannose-6-phosphate isomerase